MKTINVLIPLLFAMVMTHAQAIINPSYIRRDESSLHINKIERTNSAIIIYCTHTAPDTYKNGGWVNINPDTYIKESGGTRRYRMLNAEGIPIAPKMFNYAYKGQTHSFRLIFPRTAPDISNVDLIECETKTTCFNYYGLEVPVASYSGQQERSGRKFVRDAIKEWGSCKNVAMTMTGGDVALYGTCGWAAKGIPSRMSQKLEELNREEELIDDVVITEEGRWLILFGKNGISSGDVPDDLFSKLKKWNDEGQAITSVTFNDRGDWIAITKTHYAASSNKVLEYIKEGEDSYGELWAAHITDDGLVLCYERGYKFLGNVPQNLKDKLDETRMNVYRIKFLADGSYFIADRYGNYAYNM